MLGKLRSLQSKHSILEARIGRERARAIPDALRLQTLKKLRLKCREEIVRIENSMSRRTLAARV